MKKKLSMGVRIFFAAVLIICGVVRIGTSLNNAREAKEANAISKQSAIDELKASYDKLSIGMSYDECVKTIGREGELFSETETEYFGKTAIYLWKPDGELFTGIEGEFDNDKLSSKTWVE